MHRNAKRKITSLKHKLCKIEEGHISALEIGYYLCIKENKIFHFYIELLFLLIQLSQKQKISNEFNICLRIKVYYLVCFKKTSMVFQQ